MRIAEAAKALDVTASWLRKLEREGRIPPAARDLNHHRRYSSEAIEVLRRVLFSPDTRSSQRNGFSNRPRAKRR